MPNQRGWRERLICWKIYTPVLRFTWFPWIPERPARQPAGQAQYYRSRQGARDHQYYGKRQEIQVKETVHWWILFSSILVTTTVDFIGRKKNKRLKKCPWDVSNIDEMSSLNDTHFISRCTERKWKKITKTGPSGITYSHLKQYYKE